MLSSVKLEPTFPQSLPATIRTWIFKQFIALLFVDVLKVQNLTTETVPGVYMQT